MANFKFSRLGQGFGGRTIFNFKNKTNNQKGLSLVEIILYLTIVSFVLLAVSIFFYNIILTRGKFSARNELGYNTDFIISKLNYYTERSQNIQNLDPTTLVLSLRSGATATFNFDTVSQKITLQEGSSPLVDLNTSKVNVSGSFINLSHFQRSKNILVNLTISAKAPGAGPAWQSSISSRISLELGAR